MLLFSLLLVSCGGSGSGSGGGGGGGGGGGITYAISVTPSSVTLNGVTGEPNASKDVTVTLNGDVLAVGPLPGETRPPWIYVSLVSNTATSAIVRITGSSSWAPGSYSVTLRFTTGNTGLSQFKSVDVPVSFKLLEGQVIRTSLYGLATGSTVAAQLNGGAAVTLAYGSAQQNSLGPLEIGSSYTVNIPAQPTGQHCTFDNGTATWTGTVGSTAINLRISCNARLVPWAWVGGTKTVGDAPAYPPAPGQTGPDYRPGGRVFAAHTRDAQGNLWLFSGVDGARLPNDLWKFDISTQQWTWVSGSSALNGLADYGTRNVPATTNVPGGRRDGIIWFDSSGTLWLFGGLGYTTTTNYLLTLNDVWKYDVGTNMWTWVGGANSTVGDDGIGVYGTVPSVDNIPGGRQEMASAVDSSGALWVFGGNGYGATSTSGAMNDLWKFDPSTGIWSWVSGADHPAGTRSQGQLGIPDPTNNPGTRLAASMWADESGNLWLFGGANNDISNDLWRFDTNTRIWTWMGGAPVTDSASQASHGTYDPPGTTLTNYPTSRYHASAWTDALGNLWLFGGDGFGPGTGNRDKLNDLWSYSPATNTWSWLSGANEPNQPAVYGTQGVAEAINTPAARMDGVVWTDNSGRFWLYGGSLGFGGIAGYSEIWQANPP